MQTLRITKKLPWNNLGRDFVMGDLHGSLSSVKIALSHVKFDATVDRLFLVGDLIDRGLDSFGCLSLLKEPWCHAVMGNHEFVMLAAYRFPDNPSTPRWIRDNAMWFSSNDGRWINQYLDDQLDPVPALAELLDLVEDLPAILVVDSGTQRFNVVHAELMFPMTDIHIDHLDETMDVFHRSMDNNYQHFLWNRELAYTENPPAVQKGLSTTFCGHSISGEVKTYFSHICLDTGAYQSEIDELDGFSLTMADAKTGELVLKVVFGEDVIDYREDELSVEQEFCQSHQ